MNHQQRAMAATKADGSSQGALFSYHPLNPEDALMAKFEAEQRNKAIEEMKDCKNEMDLLRFFFQGGMHV